MISFNVTGGGKPRPYTMQKIAFWLACFGLLSAAPAVAQTRRVVGDYQLWAEAQGELALKNGDYLLLVLHGENTPAYNGYHDEGRFLGFDNYGAALQYEHFWSKKWSGGGFLQYAVPGNNYLVPGALLRHRGALGPLTFGQRFEAYRVFPVYTGRGYRGAYEPQNFASLRVDLEKIFPIGNGGLRLRPRLSYEALAEFRLQKPQDSPEKRTIDYTSLRAEVGVRLNDYLDFTPWFAYTTNYYFTLGQYSPIGQPFGGGRLNRVIPVAGLEARLTLFAGKTTFERQQLPTQH